jgi:hypothetical protein
MLLFQLNIESYHQSIQRNHGIHGSVNFTTANKLSTNNNSNNTFDVTNNALLSYRMHRSLFIGVTGANISFSNHAFSQEAYFLHLRNNTRVYESIFSDVFFQTESDEISKLYNRHLIGFGPRTEFRFSNVFLSFGTSYMYEINNIPNILIDYSRWNNFLGIAFNFDRFIVSGIFYYQPLFEDFNNYRALTYLNTTLKTNIVNIIFSARHKRESMFPTNGLISEE